MYKSDKHKRKREELRLPSLRFVVADDWMKKLGNDAFCAWLQMHTWVDRTDRDRDFDVVPQSLKATWEKLGVTRPTFYRKILRPLWEYGLIDMIEYEGSKKRGTKPKNIIVYTCPLGKHENEIKPLEKLRDYEKDYESIYKVYGKKGGGSKHKTDRGNEMDPQNLRGNQMDPQFKGKNNLPLDPYTDGPINVSNSITNVSKYLPNKKIEFTPYNWLHPKE